MKKIGVIVSVEDKPADNKDFAKYLLLLMELAGQNKGYSGKNE